jgi:predicted CoA-binding protein
MPEIRDGLTTEMIYAVVSTSQDFGKPGQQHPQDDWFWGMLKPPFEASKIVEVMRSWGTTVYPVGNVETVAGLACYPTLAQLPAPVDCAVLSLPAHLALRLLDEVAAAHIKTVWLQQSAMQEEVCQAYLSRKIRVVRGCVLLHWDVDHVKGIAKGRHVCYMHGNLERAARIHSGEDGQPVRLAPASPNTLPFNRETFSTKLLAPIWPYPGKKRG